MHAKSDNTGFYDKADKAIKNFLNQLETLMKRSYSIFNCVNSMH